MMSEKGVKRDEQLSLLQERALKSDLMEQEARREHDTASAAMRETEVCSLDILPRLRTPPLMFLH